MAEAWGTAPWLVEQQASEKWVKRFLAQRKQRNRARNEMHEAAQRAKKKK